MLISETSLHARHVYMGWSDVAEMSTKPRRHVGLGGILNVNKKCVSVSDDGAQLQLQNWAQ